MTTDTTSHAPGPGVRLDLDELRAAVRGRVVTQRDPDYDAQRTVVDGSVDLRPGAIVRVLDEADVAAVIRHARSRGLELAVRGGGHSGAGHSSTEGGLVIDMRELTGLEVDPEARTLTAGTGLTAGAVGAAAAEHGLAIGFGDTASVGIGGITLGGGIGFLARKFGMTIDSLLAARVVTADGAVLDVDERSHPDLFWALRGGGGNFGVATRFTYRLQPLPAITGGLLVLPATVDTIAGWMRLSEAAPDELTGIANVMPAPPMPFLPEDVHGRLVILGMLAYAGTGADAERTLAGFRELAVPHADLLAKMPYPGLFAAEEAGGAGEEYHPLAVSRTMFVDHVGEAEATEILRHLEASDASLRVAQLRPLGGAMARVPADATAFAHRASRVLINVAAFHEGGDDRAAKAAWVDGLVAALDQGHQGAYVNFVGDEGEAGVRAAYPPATLHRLAAVKRRYDPDNVFRRNHNIQPTETA